MGHYTVAAVLLLTCIPTPDAIAQISYPYAINTLAGTGSPGDGGPATAALLEFPQSVAVNAGKIYFGDTGNGRIRVFSPGGAIQPFALGTAVSLKFDSAGNLYESDGLYHIYKISPAGVATLVAGAATGYDGDGGPAIAAKLSGPMGVAVDTQGDVYVADTQNHCVRKITPDGMIHTIAGIGIAGIGGENVAAVSSPLTYPWAVEVDSAGNLFVSEQSRIRRIDASGNIRTIAGNGANPTDGLAINSAVGSRVALAIDHASNLYLADTDYNMVRMISPVGNIVTLAGSPTAGFAGDGAYHGLLNGPAAVAVDPQGNLFIADEFNHRIREVTAVGLVSTVAGATHFGGDGGQAAAALLHQPEHAIPDGARNLYVADTDNNRIRKIDDNGVITTIAGTGDCTYGGDFGKAASATLCIPEALAFDSAGNLYIADWGNHAVRRIDSAGVITTVAGGVQTAGLQGPFGLAFDATGKLYVSDNVNHRVSMVSTGGVLTPFAGNGTKGLTGDGGTALAAALNAPTHLAAASDGSLYIADKGNDRVRKVSPSGLISTVLSGSVSGIPLLRPDGMVLDPAGNLYVAWQNSEVITITTPAGKTSIFAGTGLYGLSGDGGLALNATFSAPAGLSQDAAGDFYVGDLSNNRVRKLTLDTLTAIAATSGDNQSAATVATVASPLTVTASFRGGAPLAGVPIAFAVTAGSASLSQQSVATDSLGKASVTVTMGSTAGPVVITATAPGAPSVQFHLTATPILVVPVVTVSGVIGAGGSTPPVTQLSPGGFATIFGSNFVPADTFQSAAAGNWPTQLAGVCVTVGGLPAFITFVSSTQINFQAPSVPANTSVNLQVTSGCNTSQAQQSALVPVPTLDATPEFLYWLKNAGGQDPIVAVDAVSGAYIAASGSIPGATFTPAKPGEILTIYGVSFGATNPAAVPGIVPAAAAKSIYTPVVKLGSTTLDPAAVLYAGVSPGTAGLYQLNFVVPPLPDGDYPIVLSLGPFSTPAGGFLTIKN